MRRRLPTVLLHVVLIAGAVAAIAPIAWMFAASLMPDGQANAEPPREIAGGGCGDRAQVSRQAGGRANLDEEDPPGAMLHHDRRPGIRSPARRAQERKHPPKSEREPAGRKAPCLPRASPRMSRNEIMDV